MDGTAFFLGLLFGSFGLGYFVYGKKQHRFVPMLSGLILMAYPYFISGITKLVIIGLMLIALPFIFKGR